MLIRALASYRPVPEPIAIRLVTRGSRRLQYAAWWRLALGGVEHDPVDLVDHEDFFRFGSEPALAKVIERHLNALNSGS